MTDLEFDIIDELYFVTPYADLKEESALSDEILLKGLKSLLERKWIRCFRNAKDEILNGEIDLENKFSTYFYLASKEGLLAHN